MTKTEWKQWIGVAGRMVLACALIFAQSVWAGQDQKTKDKADSPQKTTAQQAVERQYSLATATKAQTQEAQDEASQSAVAEDKSSGDASHQGIKVHGHWTIEVRNPDGTMVSHREFENSLFQPSSALGAILSRGGVVGAWTVWLFGNGSPLCLSGTSQCVITEPSQTSLVVVDSYNLTIGASGPSAANVTLSGSVTVPSPGTVTQVSTYIVVCKPTVTPSACTTSPGGASSLLFSQANLSNGGIGVAPGQTVAVTVIFSFS